MTYHLYTLGHSTRSLEEFLQLLQAYQITHLVDVRTIPRSRHNPQFDKSSLPGELEKVGVKYTHLPELGGLRKPQPDSRNTAWRNQSFQAFADYMGTQSFREGLESLIRLASEDKLAIMCAEAVPWRCHRSLIADALTVRGIEVEHILSPTSSQPHELTKFAKVEGTKITYPAESNPGDPRGS
jgi:uncharacterized protein (DUF488 family)